MPECLLPTPPPEFDNFQNLVIFLTTTCVRPQLCMYVRVPSYSVISVHTTHWDMPYQHRHETHAGKVWHGTIAFRFGFVFESIRACLADTVSNATVCITGLMITTEKCSDI